MALIVIYSPLPYRATHHTSTKTRPPTPPFGPYATSNQLTTRRSASVMTILGYTSASYMTSQKQLDRELTVNQFRLSDY
ncbi:Hypothetical predicted protein [Octopus vulgaris]|uniref:Uncharacterized protein n=1 Tax=Octopus vulgaris TaxID=6645 RepID=A0AA36FFZ6_OCTVU|nr:Hypothetical predicted protein [Octopus vulgaris]